MPTATPFNNLITFSRGSNATVTGSNGLIQWAPNNLLTFSEQFDNAAWLKLAGGTGVAPVVTANVGVAPDGTTTADRVVFNRGAGTTSADTSRIFQDVPDPSNGVGTVSFYVRSTDGTSSYTMLIEAGFGNQQITVTGSWQRFSVTSTSSSLNAILGTAGNISAQSVDVLVWGGQTEIGSTATTYNPTTVKNLLGFSEAFDNAAWTKAQASIVTGAQANPVNGLFNAQKLMENTATNVHRVQQGFTTATGVTYTFSCYAKAAERSWVYLYDDAANGFAFFDLANGVKGTIAAGWTSTSITPVGNGWYRISGTATEASGGAGNQLIGLASANGTSSYTGDGNSGVYIYGAQLSDSASLDPYVPTPGAAPSSTAFYGPRFDFDPVTLQPRGLLVEEQRTNLFTYSEQFDNADWGKSNTTVTANTAVAPDGRTTADTITSTSTSSELSRAVTVGTVQHTFSIYLKHNNNQWVVLYGERGFVWFDVLNGVVGTQQANVSGAITAVGNGWYRCAVTSTSLDTSYAAALAMASGDNSTTEVNGGAVFAWGAQLEAGAFATSYIPTVASTVTRSADVATITGQNFAQWYGQTAGTFVAVGDYLINANWRRFLTADDVAASGNNRIIVNGDQNQQLLVTNGGVNQASLNAGTAPAANVVTRIASAYALDNFAAVRDGGTAATDTSGTLPTVNRLAIGLHPNGGEYLNGHIQSIRFIPVRGADFQLQALST